MRKSIITMGAAAVVAISVHAQTKGFISGQMSMSSTSSPDSDLKNVTGTFGPQVGFNVSDRIVVGLGLVYTGGTISNTLQSGAQSYDVKSRGSQITFTPFARYVKKVDEKFALYGELAVGVGFGSAKNQGLTVDQNGNTVVGETRTDNSTFSGSVGPGVLYSFTPRWSMNAGWGALRYESRTSKTDTEGAEKFTNNSFGLALNPGAITFGLNWLF